MIGLKKDLKAPSFAQLKEWFIELGFPAYRSKQLIHWIYNKKIDHPGQLTDFSKRERQFLEENSYISQLEILRKMDSRDGTVKFQFKLEDGEEIETVLIPEKERRTLCISTQVGCGIDCQFCLTAKGGLKRNLKAHEIIDQYLRVSSEYEISNIVMMGMGEPLANFQEVSEAIDRLTDSNACTFSPRRITVSTAGLVPGIQKLGEHAQKVNLAVSLNATSNAIRDRIMPINRTYPIEMLLDACRKYPLAPRRRIFFEYVLLKGVNDSLEDARRIPKLLKGIPSKVNLIPFNEFSGSPFIRPDESRILAFQKILVDSHLTTFIRKSRGNDVLAACGQLIRSGKNDVLVSQIETPS
ncbi:MAG: 23S rRNA (adenine(2503)-C(2))-methyltransferase RlmN [Nitrospirae bacterium]|nr:23S rRNA (adenine(2503)-C(2))-methyltransferase RlmN [Nitrospirota bacterium]MBI3594519.1 23S rRNA (adenine(2503)-C(2))-methyltransferase RlmN [Nitrospirota bacterium]